MTRSLRALLVLLAAIAAAAFTTTAVRADVTLYSISPVTVVSTGRPLQLTLSGTGLQQTTRLEFTPPVNGTTFAAFNDTTLLVTLPAGVATGSYSVRVITLTGGSDPATAPSFYVSSAPPKATPQPPHGAAIPTPLIVRDAPVYPETGVVDLPLPTARRTAPVAALPTPQGDGSGPLRAVALGLGVGGLIWLLWGRSGRLIFATHQGIWAQLVGRPLLTLKLGHICVRCGRLHTYWGTRRDLWRGGTYCSTVCFVSGHLGDATHGEELELPPDLSLEELGEALDALFAQISAADEMPPLVPAGTDVELVFRS